MNENLPALRRISSWRDNLPWDINELKCDIDLDKELWLMLYSVSEVKSLAKELFQEFEIDQDLFKTTWKRFRAFIRQANNFWEIATRTNFRSSPLLFYYSFLILVKAFVLLKNPSLSEKVKHGIFYSKHSFNKELKDKFIGVNKGNNQLFSLYYREIFNAEPPLNFKITDLFSYTIDISYQYLRCDMGELRIVPVIHRICYDDNNKKCWVVLATSNYIKPTELNNTFQKFSEYFELTETPKVMTLTFRDIFQFEKGDFGNLNFYQFKENKLIKSEPNWFRPVLDCSRILKEVFGVYLIPNYLPDNKSFYISLPLSSDKQIQVPMSEEVSIYLLMFFISELVRYQPDYLDEILESKESWLFRSFIEEYPLKFLRIITSRIMNKIVVLKRI